MLYNTKCLFSIMVIKAIRLSNESICFVCLTLKGKSFLHFSTSLKKAISKTVIALWYPKLGENFLI